MARRKTIRKPARKRSASKSAGSSFTAIGWLAAAALGIGWAVTDGRALTYVEAARSSVEKTSAAADASRDGRATPAETRRPKPQRVAEEAPAPDRTRMPPMRVARPEPAAQPTRTAAVAPSPAPRMLPMRMPREAAVQPTGVARPAAAIAPPPPVAAPPTAVSLAAGGERHATRRLDVHASPAEGSKVIALIDTGTSVTVMKSDGRWRYVKSSASRAEGWVDGGYLAGESAPARQSAFTPIGYRSTEPPPVPRLIITSPVPPMSVDATR